MHGKETPESKVWFETVKWDLLHGGVNAVLQWVRLRQSVEPLGQHNKTLKTLENYLIFHSERMNYRQRLFEGRSIGSGQVEGACKNLIGERLKQTGARWSEPRVARMGVICALRYDDQWDNYWKQAN